MSLQFISSENAITDQANAIHRKAQDTVNIGSGPCIERLPSCIIVGNFKCGTRELIDFMSMHPRIKIRTKPFYELHFFDNDLKYSKGLEWYRKEMPCSYSNQLTIVKTPSYFQSLTTPGRIHAMNSSIKIIVLVREPVSRTVSQFTFHNNNLKRYNLDIAVLDKQTGRINRNSYFIKHSIYDEGMERYLSLFNRSQIKVIDTEDFKHDPYTVLHDLEEFLNIEHVIRRENIVLNPDKGYYCLRQDRNSETAACYGSKRGRNSSDVRNSIKVSSALVDKLKSFFKPHNERFFNLSGRLFDW